MALDFDGVDDYVNIGNLASLNFGVGDFSVIAWFKINSISGYRGIISKWDGIGGSGHNGWCIGSWGNDARVTFEILGADQDQMVSTNNFNDGLWHEIAAIRTGGVMYLYIDGNQEATENNNQNVDNTKNLLIGRRYCNGQSWNGDLADVKVYNRALTLAEIQSDMYRYTIPDSSCKGMWRLDEGKMDSAPGGVDCADISGNGNHGTCEASMGNEDWVAGPPITPLLG